MNETKISRPEVLDIFDEYATDESLENNGAWVAIGKGARLLIARAGNKAHSRALSAKIEKNQLVLDQGDDTADAVSNEIMVDVVAETTLLGWENLAYKGKVLPYSVENAKMLLAHKDFRRRVVRLSEDQAAYKAKLETEQGEA